MSRQYTFAETDQGTTSNGPVECLGRTFPDDVARRAYFRERLREKLRDPALRQVPGFPCASDEDILGLSDPPYYTACPNPFLDELVRLYGHPYDPAADSYHRDPFAVDVSEGKTGPLYAAHSYHTKVPYRAIVPAILHYTDPGDLVLDGFAGTGMTGVAAQMCGQPDAEFRLLVEAEWRASAHPDVPWGPRRVLLNDLSPAATFIAANYNLPWDAPAFARASRQLLDELEAELGWMYETRHSDGQAGRIDYTVWSEVFACPHCGGEITFLEEALDTESGRVREQFPCPHCGANLTKSRLDRLYESYFDPVIGETIKRVRRAPARIHYRVGKQRFDKAPDAEDLALVKKADSRPLPAAVPTNKLPFMHMTHQRARMEAFGITHLHHFFLPRAAQSLGWLWEKAAAAEEPRLRSTLLFFVEQALWTMSVLNRYRPTGYSQVNQYLTGVYYVPSQISECSPWYVLEGKRKRLARAFQRGYAVLGQAAISTGDAAHLGLPANSVDYIFTDPPFGENIYYADLNYLVESWHRVWTDTGPEAIIDRAKGKQLLDYQDLMRRCFEEYYRVLKPGRWMTVVFHNSRNAVWNAIQEALQAAGFVVADVRTLDKQQRSYRQVTSTAVKQDLVISTYKPNGGLEERFSLAEGKEEGAWDFTRAHLRQLPVCIMQDNQLEVVAERQAYLLYDRMVAFHVQRGITVPLSAPAFLAGLEQRFPERDGMYFLPDQVVEYDRQRLVARGVRQLELFVTDEASAVQWLRQALAQKPQTFQEIHPHFIKEIAGWQKHEQALELSRLLEENFLRYSGQGPIPDAIWTWMRMQTEYREQMSGQDPATAGSSLRLVAKDRWYVPDPSRADDLEKRRESMLLREFEEYRASSQQKLDVFRLEAVRAGFKKAWQERDYGTIIAVAHKLPDEVLQEDPKLLMWYDQAETRISGEK
ncbi:MAG: DNA methylase [Anaerolineae bacterium]|nr:DNA methylase [Anaerolineae bacterium]